MIGIFFLIELLDDVRTLELFSESENYISRFRSRREFNLIHSISFFVYFFYLYRY